MDTITHALFGVITYRSINKEAMAKPLKRALLFTSLAGCQIPDIDVISKWWDTEGQYQMWHRGIAHSLFMVPVWSSFLYLFCRMVWKVRERQIFYVGFWSVFIHITSDLFNAWGTGYLEPFSSIRIAFGTIPIVDFTIWALIALGFLFRRIKKIPAHRVFRTVWALIALHFLLQSAQGYLLYHLHKERYDQLALSASFVPTKFKIIGKKGDQVEILDASLWKEPRKIATLKSRENADLEYLFAKNPKAKTLYEWAPFVVIVENEKEIGIYDPRFYRNGQSFLFESAKK